MWELVNVNFAYPTGDDVLQSVDLSVARGETVALVGPTGGGKSTLVNLVCRFYEPTAGQVQINGVDYRDVRLHWYRSKIGVVLQQVAHFSEGVFAKTFSTENLAGDRRSDRGGGESRRCTQFHLRTAWQLRV